MIERNLSEDGAALELVFSERFKFFEVQTLIRECESVMTGVERVTLNIAELKFIDTSMLSQFISIYGGLNDAVGAASDIQFCICNCSEQARKVLEVSRLDQIFALEGDPVS